jgi:hypothetical protein
MVFQEGGTVRVVGEGFSRGDSRALGLSLPLSLVALACLEGLSSEGVEGGRDLGAKDGRTEAREVGMATAGIMPMEMPVQSDAWSRRLWSMSSVVEEVMPLQRKACLAMSMMWPTWLQKDGSAFVRSL